MTATKGRGTDPHPEVSEISHLTEGLLQPPRSTAVREHIAGCLLCADVLASLTEIRGLLGTLPGPQRMPADVAGRIDAALAAEAHLDTVLPRQHVTRGTREASDDSDVPRETSIVERLRPRHSRWRGGLLVAASVAAVTLVVGALYEATSSGGSDRNDSASATAVQGTEAAGLSVAEQVRQLLADQEPGAAGKSANSPMLDRRGTTTATPPHEATGVPECVLQATERSQQPLAAERDVYQGTPSYLVVLPHPGDTTRVDAYVVGAACTSASPAVLLLQGTYPR
ncbi:hypothetical protein [Actinacidiphila sp. ITFR-21]|uniref:hypothetical protein n=1 Tax=Actinacidiphila sp. ITFR-21 TaxID=3075199 RepID=UPI00288BB684|nr:hypothetical protein [Streptomyces sp. ITFR-21]WNI16661.1 hypothetical protein RLT57_14815 [Streptomyces sp. ITFR-21]